MTLDELLEKIRNKSVMFSEVISFIEANYSYTPTAFKNGTLFNEASQNQGSAKVFYFAKLNQFNPEDTLLLFAEHYQNVLETPDSDNHQNIRQFINNGWGGIAFEGETLK